MFGSFNSKCLRLCYIYCRFGEQLLALCWWVGQVSTTEHSCSWLLPHVSQNRYLHSGENSVFPVCDPRQNQLSFPHFADSWCSSGRFFMVAACDQVQPVTKCLKHHSFFRDNQVRELTRPGWDSSDGCGQWWEWDKPSGREHPENKLGFSQWTVGDQVQGSLEIWIRNICR